MADINSLFVPGGMLTSTPGMSLPSLGSLLGMPQMPDLSGLMGWRLKLEQARAQDEAQMRAMQMQQAQQDMDARRVMMQRMASEAERPMPTRGPDGPANPAVEIPWYSLQGVARTPVGGPGIVPGYSIDPTKLPPEMRAKASGFESGGLSDRQVLDASRSGALEREAERHRFERELAQPTSTLNRLQQKQGDENKRASQSRQNAYYGR